MHVHYRILCCIAFIYIYGTFILNHGMHCFSSVLVGELVFPFVLMQFVYHVRCDKNKCSKVLSHCKFVYTFLYALL